MLVSSTLANHKARGRTRSYIPSTPLQRTAAEPHQIISRCYPFLNLSSVSLNLSIQPIHSSPFAIIVLGENPFQRYAPPSIRFQSIPSPIHSLDAKGGILSLQSLTLLFSEPGERTNTTVAMFKQRGRRMDQSRILSAGEAVFRSERARSSKHPVPANKIYAV